MFALTCMFSFFKILLCIIVVQISLENMQSLIEKQRKKADALRKRFAERSAAGLKFLNVINFSLFFNVISFFIFADPAIESLFTDDLHMSLFVESTLFDKTDVTSDRPSLAPDFSGRPINRNAVLVPVVSTLPAGRTDILGPLVLSNHSAVRNAEENSINEFQHLAVVYTCAAVILRQRCLPIDTESFVTKVRIFCEIPPRDLNKVTV